MACLENLGGQPSMNAENKYEDTGIMSVIGTIYEDVTTDALGEIGSWQWLVTMVCTILMASCFFQHYQDIFLLEPNKVMCVPAQEHENIYNETLCSYTLANGTEIPCKKWHLKLLWMVWVKKSWLLFCDDKMKLLLTAVIFRLGTIFGFVIFGLLADSFGRRIAIIVNVFAVLVLRAVATFCDSEAWFRLVLFLEALFGTATMFLGLVIVTEIASNSWRSWLSVVVISPRLIALVSTVHIANGTSNPETYNIIGCLCGFIFIFMLRYLPESPQWMLYNRKIHKAEKLLTNAATKNNINFSAEFKIRPVNQRAYFCLDETMTCFRVLSVHNVRVIVAVTLVFWGVFYFIWGFLYLKIYSEDTGSYILLKVFCFLGGMGFLTAVLSSILSLQRVLIINIVFTSCVTAAVIVLKHQIVHEILSSIALASGLMVHGLVLNMTPRYYAINIRATLFGCCHATGQLGAMISYIIFIYKAMDDITFVAVELGLSLILVLLSFVLPKVDGRELPDVVDDVDFFSELSKPLRWATQKRSSPSKEEVQMRIYSFNSAPSASADNRSFSTPARLIDFTNLWHRFFKCTNKKRKPTVAPISREELAVSLQVSAGTTKTSVMTHASWATNKTSLMTHASQPTANVSHATTVTSAEPDSASNTTIQPSHSTTDEESTADENT